MTVTQNIHVGLSAWAGSTGYIVGNRVSNGGHAYHCIASGTSDLTATGGPSGTGASITDGGATWKWLSFIDRTDLVTWASSLPATLTEPYIGQIWNDGEILNNASSITLIGVVTSTTNTITLTAAPGEAWNDHPQVRSHPFTYNAAYGASIKTTSGYFIIFRISVGGVTFKNLQISSNVWCATPFFWNNADAVGNGGIDRCIVLFGGGKPGTQYIANQPGTNGAPLTLRNSLFINLAVGNQPSFDSYYSDTIQSCTFAGVIDTPNTNAFLVREYYNPPQRGVNNCAFFGISTGRVDYPAGVGWTFDHGATDSTTTVPVGVTTMPPSSAFVSALSTNLDFRLKPGSSLIGAGADDGSGVTTDATGRARGTTWDIGAWQSKPPIVQSIGRGGATSGRTYSTITAWIAGLDPDLIATDNSFVGLLYNDIGIGATLDGEFDDRAMNIAGHNTDGTHTITLTTAPGHSFRDHASKATNRLSYNQAVGVGIQSDNGHTNMLVASDPYTTISNLQVWTHGTTASALNANANYCTFANCIAQGSLRDDRYSMCSTLDGASNSVFYNILAIVMRDYVFGLGGGSGWHNGSYGNMVNCTAVKPTENSNAVTGSLGGGFVASYGGNLLRNGMSFGFAYNYAQNPGTPDGHNCTDYTIISGTIGNLVSQTYGDQFVNPSQVPPTAMDFRLKNSSTGLNAGVDVTTVTLQGGRIISITDDMLGNARPTNGLWDIGCEESPLTYVPAYHPIPDFFDLYSDATYRPPQRYPQHIRRVVVPPYQPPPPPAAIKTFYITTAATTSAYNWWGLLQEGGTAPSAALAGYGYAAAKIAANGFIRSRLGANNGVSSTSSLTTSYIDSPVAGPILGSSNTNTTSGDSFRSPVAYTGTFPSANWVMAFGMRTTTAGTNESGRIRCRVWASTSATAASPRELTTSTQIGTTTPAMGTTTTTYTSTVTWAAPAVTLTNEYLFFQLEWQIVAAGNSNNDTAQFYQSAASIVTPLFTPPGLGVTGRLIRNQAAQTISATGDAGGVGNVIGTLTANQDPQTISANGTLGLAPVTGTLTANQDPQTISANGTLGPLPVTGTLTANQAVQTINANGVLTDVGGLTANQAVQTIGANGSLTTSGGLGNYGPGVVLMMHADGASGSTTFIDETGKTLTARGTAQVIATAKFGTGAVDFSAARTAGISTNNAVDFNFGSGPFTVECWAYTPSGLVANNTMVSQYASSGSNLGWMFWVSGGRLRFYWTTDGINFNVLQGSSFTQTVGTWYHYAVDRNAAGTLRIYQNGVLANAVANAVTYFPSTLNGVIGNIDEVGSTNYGYPGYLDEIRVIKGYAKYDGNITLPTAPYAASFAQDAQTINATGTVGGGLPPIVGNLSANQDPQTISAAGTVSGGLATVTGTLTANQAVQTLVAWATSPNALLVSYIDSGGATGLDGEAGLKFQSSANTDYNRIGLRAIAGATGLHTVKLYNYDTLAVLQTASVNLTGATTGQFYYVTMPTTTLVSGTNYALTAATVASERFPSNAPIRLRNAVAGQTSSAFYDTAWHLPAPDVCYYGVDLDYVSTSVSGALNGSQATQTGGIVNYIANPRAEGAGTGQFATNPTGWSVSFLQLGIFQTIVGTGTENGIPYIDYLISGTPNNTGFYEVYVNLPQTVPASSSDVWYGSFYARIAAGSLTNVGNVRPKVVAYSAISQSGYQYTDYAASTLTQAGGLSTRYSAGGSLASWPTTDNVVLILGVGLTDTLPINFTLRIGAPQLERNAVTSLTLPPVGAPGWSYKIGEGTVSTPTGITGNLTANQAVQTISANGTPTDNANLTANQAVQTISANGALTDNANLTASQAVQTISANGGSTVGGSLTANQAVQTLGANGTVGTVLPTVTGTLTANQAVQTLGANGASTVGGNLTANQAVQTINAGGTPTDNANLSANQAVQTINANGGPRPNAALTANQAVQTINAAGGPTDNATLTGFQAVQTLNSTGSVVSGISATLVANQAVQTINASGTLNPFNAGTLNAFQAVQTISATGTPVAGGNLTANQAVQTFNSAGTTADNANLSALQAVQTINANGTTTDNAALTANQAVQTINANGASTVRGTLTANQAVQTISATGSVLFGVGGGLTANQAVQTINASGTVAQPVIGTLTANQAVQTLSANGTPTTRGNLTANQAVQTFNAAGTPVADGNLSALQAVQTINAHGTMGAITGSLIVFQGVQTLASNGGPIARGTLTASQMPNLFYGIGRVGAEQTRVILMA